MQLIDADFNYDKSPTESDFQDKLNDHLEDYYINSDFFDRIYVESGGCTQTGIASLIIS